MVNLNLDIIIVLTFLLINLGVGLYYSKGVKTLEDYAVGKRNFNTTTIAATIVATWIGGDFFAVSIAESYRDGLWYCVLGAGDIFSLLIVGYFLAPKLRRFVGDLSVAETMGKSYGSKVRLITAISSIAAAIGMIALQIKVFVTVFNYFFGFPVIYATLISSMVVITYSAFGGIRAVTFTDIIQFITFGVLIPMFALFIWQTLGDPKSFVDMFQSNPSLDYHQLMDPSNIKFLPHLTFFIFGLVDLLNPTTFQRVLMAKSANQIRRSFITAALVCLFIHCFSCFIGLVILSNDPNLNADNMLMYIFDSYTITGLKGLMLVGIMSMVMSTADSWINSASVIFSNDLYKPLGLGFTNELFVSRIFAVFIGMSALILSLTSNDLIELIFLQANFFMPIVTPALILAVIGFRISERVVLTGMFAGIITIIVWKFYLQLIIDIDSVLPATAVNLVILILTHYFLQEPGGWPNDDDLDYINKVKAEFKISNIDFRKTVLKTINHLQSIDLIKYCNAHSPKQKEAPIYFAIGMLTILVVSFLIDKATYHQHFWIINILQAIALFITTYFSLYNLWLVGFTDKYSGVIWYLSVFTGLAFISSFLVLMSNFSHLSMMIFIFNLTMIGMLLNWQATIAMVITGAFCALSLYNYITDPSLTIDVVNIYDLQLKVVYIVLGVIGFLVAFLKPKQELQELTQQKNEHLSNQIKDREDELIQLLNLRNELINNFTHETRAPISGTVNLAQAVLSCYDRLPKEEIIKSLKEISKSGHRLESWANNLCDLAQLNNLKASINLQAIDLSVLLKNRVDFCRKIHETQNHDLEFVFAIEPNIIANLDEYYIKQTIDNLVINAIKYNKTGRITILLSKQKNLIEFSICDEGVGIPDEEIYDVFAPFTISSKTKTSAGGRGIGLTLCKKVINIHSGEIWAKNNAEAGVTFHFTIPSDLKATKNEKKNTFIARNNVTEKFFLEIESQIIEKITESLQSKNMDNDTIKKLYKMFEARMISI